ELAPPGPEHGQAPARFGGEVDQVCERGPGRRAQPVLQVLVPLRQDLQIERQHQRGAAGGSGALDQALDEPAVPHHVQLEPERRLRVRGDVLDRADAHRRQRERNAEALGGASRQDLAVCMLHARESGSDRRNATPVYRWTRSRKQSPFRTRPEAHMKRFDGLVKAVHRPWVRRTALILGALFVLFGLLGYLALPGIIKSQAEKAVTAALHRKFTIERVVVRPYALAVSIQGVRVYEPDGHDVFASFQDLQARISPCSLLPLA